MNPFPNKVDSADPQSANKETRASAASATRESLPSTRVNPRDGTVLRLIPAGACLIGSTPEQTVAAAALDIWGHPDLLVSETPQFSAFLPDYYMAVYPVTNAQFAAFLNATQPSPDELRRLAPELENIRAATAAAALYPAAKVNGRPAAAVTHYQVVSGFERHPVIHVSWFGAEAYRRWAGLRLPTELEWEKAARGTDGRIFPWGNQWRGDALRWFGGDRREGETTAPVDAYPQGCSPYGIFQMAGNVDEWCADGYQWDVYRRYAAGDLRAPASGQMRVVRGGTCVAWQKIRFRCAHRRSNDPGLINILFTGIRCAADASESVVYAHLAAQS